MERDVRIEMVNTVTKQMAHIMKKMIPDMNVVGDEMTETEIAKEIMVDIVMTDT